MLKAWCVASTAFFCLSHIKMDIGSSHIQLTMDRPQVPEAYVDAFMAPVGWMVAGGLLCFCGDDFKVYTKRHVFHRKKGEGLLIQNK